LLPADRELWVEVFRNTRLLPDGSFYESGHFNGSVDMKVLVKVFLEEMKLRSANLPLRPDHGIKGPEDEGLTHIPVIRNLSAQKDQKKLSATRMSF